jgi:hypothetical protein
MGSRNIFWSEKVLERKLTEQVALRGGKALKFNSSYDTSYPDRIVLMPGGVTHFVELKSTGATQTPLQKARMEYLSSLGFSCTVVDHMDKLVLFLALLDGVQPNYLLGLIQDKYKTGPGLKEAMEVLTLKILRK